MLFHVLLMVLLGGYALYSWFRPMRAFFFLPLFLFTHQWKLILFGIPWNGLEMMIGVLFFVHLLRFFVLEQDRTFWRGLLQSQLNIYSPLLFPLGLLFFAALAVLFVPRELIFETGLPGVAPEVYKGTVMVLGIVKGWFLPLVLFHILALGYIRERQDAIRLLLAFSMGVFFIVALGFLWVYSFGYPTTWDGRFAGLFVSPNYLIFLVLPVLLFSIVFSVQRLLQHMQHLKAAQNAEDGSLMTGDHPDVQEYIVLGIIFIVLLVAFILARSYASWMVFALLMGLMVLGLFSSKVRYLLLGVVLLVSSSLFFLEGNSEKLRLFTETQQRSSTSVRLQVYSISWGLIREHPLLGVGPGLYEVYYKQNATRLLGNTLPYEWVMLHPHNLYLALWLGLGLGGLVWFMLYAIKALILVYRHGDWVLGLPLLVPFVHGIVDTPFWKLDVMLLVVTLILLPLWVYCIPSNQKK